MIRPILVLALLALAACDLGTSEPFVRQTFGFRFESDLGNFEPDGTDLTDPPVTWSIERSMELAEDGEWSVKFHLENVNDAGKIWLERGFQLNPGRTYDVVLAFDFASADFGNVNLWTIIAGASAINPEDADDLTFQEDTGNGASSDVGFVWERKEYRFTVNAGPDGVIWVSIGVWGTSEFTRDYFVDDVDLAFTLQ